MNLIKEHLLGWRRDGATTSSSMSGSYNNHDDDIFANGRVVLHDHLHVTGTLHRSLSTNSPSALIPTALVSSANEEGETMFSLVIGPHIRIPLTANMSLRPTLPDFLEQEKALLLEPEDVVEEKEEALAALTSAFANTADENNSTTNNTTNNTNTTANGDGDMNSSTTTTTVRRSSSFSFLRSLSLPSSRSNSRAATPNKNNTNNNNTNNTNTNNTTTTTRHTRASSFSVNNHNNHNSSSRSHSRQVSPSPTRRSGSFSFSFSSNNDNVLLDTADAPPGRHNNNNQQLHITLTSRDGRYVRLHCGRDSQVWSRWHAALREALGELLCSKCLKLEPVKAVAAAVDGVAAASKKKQSQSSSSGDITCDIYSRDSTNNATPSNNKRNNSSNNNSSNKKLNKNNNTHNNSSTDENMSEEEQHYELSLKKLDFCLSRAALLLPPAHCHVLRAKRLRNYKLDVNEVHTRLRENIVSLSREELSVFLQKVACDRLLIGDRQFQDLQYLMEHSAEKGLLSEKALKDLLNTTSTTTNSSSNMLNNNVVIENISLHSPLRSSDVHDGIMENNGEKKRSNSNVTEQNSSSSSPLLPPPQSPTDNNNSHNHSNRISNSTANSDAQSSSSSSSSSSGRTSPEEMFLVSISSPRTTERLYQRLGLLEDTVAAAATTNATNSETGLTNKSNNHNHDNLYESLLYIAAPTDSDSTKSSRRSAHLDHRNTVNNTADSNNNYNNHDDNDEKDDDGSSNNNDSSTLSDHSSIMKTLDMSQFDNGEEESDGKQEEVDAVTAASIIRKEDIPTTAVVDQENIVSDNNTSTAQVWKPHPSVTPAKLPSPKLKNKVDIDVGIDIDTNRAHHVQANTPTDTKSHSNYSSISHSLIVDPSIHRVYQRCLRQLSTSFSASSLGSAHSRKSSGSTATMVNLRRIAQPVALFASVVSTESSSSSASMHECGGEQQQQQYDYRTPPSTSMDISAITPFTLGENNQEKSEKLVDDDKNNHCDGEDLQEQGIEDLQQYVNVPEKDSRRQAAARNHFSHQSTQVTPSLRMNCAQPQETSANNSPMMSEKLTLADQVMQLMTTNSRYATATNPSGSMLLSHSLQSESSVATYFSDPPLVVLHQTSPSAAETKMELISAVAKDFQSPPATGMQQYQHHTAAATSGMDDSALFDISPSSTQVQSLILTTTETSSPDSVHVHINVHVVEPSRDNVNADGLNILASTVLAASLLSPVAANNTATTTTTSATTSNIMRDLPVGSEELEEKQNFLYTPVAYNDGDNIQNMTREQQDNNNMMLFNVSPLTPDTIEQQQQQQHLPQQQQQSTFQQNSNTHATEDVNTNNVSTMSHIQDEGTSTDDLPGYLISKKMHFAPPELDQIDEVLELLDELSQSASTFPLSTYQHHHHLHHHQAIPHYVHAPIGSSNMSVGNYSSNASSVSMYSQSQHSQSHSHSQSHGHGQNHGYYQPQHAPYPYASHHQLGTTHIAANNNNNNNNKYYPQPVDPTPTTGSAGYYYQHVGLSSNNSAHSHPMNNNNNSISHNTQYYCPSLDTSSIHPTDELASNHYDGHQQNMQLHSTNTSGMLHYSHSMILPPPHYHSNGTIVNIHHSNPNHGLVDDKSLVLEEEEEHVSMNYGNSSHHHHYSPQKQQQSSLMPWELYQSPPPAYQQPAAAANDELDDNNFDVSEIFSKLTFPAAQQKHSPPTKQNNSSGNMSKTSRNNSPTKKKAASSNNSNSSSSPSKKKANNNQKQSRLSEDDDTTDMYLENSNTIQHQQLNKKQTSETDDDRFLKKSIVVGNNEALTTTTTITVASNYSNTVHDRRAMLWTKLKETPSLIDDKDTAPTSTTAHIHSSTPVRRKQKPHMTIDTSSGMNTADSQQQQQNDDSVLSGVLHTPRSGLSSIAQTPLSSNTHATRSAMHLHQELVTTKEKVGVLSDRLLRIRSKLNDEDYDPNATNHTSMLLSPSYSSTNRKMSVVEGVKCVSETATAVDSSGISGDSSRRKLHFTDILGDDSTTTNSSSNNIAQIIAGQNSVSANITINAESYCMKCALSSNNNTTMIVTDIHTETDIAAAVEDVETSNNVLTTILVTKKLGWIGLVTLLLFITSALTCMFITPSTFHYHPRNYLQNTKYGYYYTAKNMYHHQKHSSKKYHQDNHHSSMLLLPPSYYLLSPPSAVLQQMATTYTNTEENSSNNRVIVSAMASYKKSWKKHQSIVSSLLQEHQLILKSNNKSIHKVFLVIQKIGHTVKMTVLQCLKKAIVGITMMPAEHQKLLFE